MKQEINDRSFKTISLDDLKRLAEIARKDRMDLFNRNPSLGEFYKDRVICVALCQGAALHYLNGKNGIKDFDVWTFFREHPDRPFPYRRSVVRDFKVPKFGKTPDHPDFEGRRVDLFGRSIPWEKNQSPVDAVRNYLKFSNNATPKHLAKKAVIILEPEELLGSIAWPI